jgi:hypothetical protein
VRTNGLALLAYLSTFFFRHRRDTLSRMQLTEDDLREFMEIWTAEFRESIGLDDARQSAAALLGLYMRLTSQPGDGS